MKSGHRSIPSPLPLHLQFSFGKRSPSNEKSCKEIQVFGGDVGQASLSPPQSKTSSTFKSRINFQVTMTPFEQHVNRLTTWTFSTFNSIIFNKKKERIEKLPQYESGKSIFDREQIWEKQIKSDPYFSMFFLFYYSIHAWLTFDWQKC